MNGDVYLLSGHNIRSLSLLSLLLIALTGFGIGACQTPQAYHEEVPNEPVAPVLNTKGTPPQSPYGVSGVWFPIYDAQQTQKYIDALKVWGHAMNNGNEGKSR